MNRVVFFGLSKILLPSISWLEENKHPYLIITNSAQVAKFNTPNAHLSEQKLVIANTLKEIQHPWLPLDIGISVGAPWIFSESFLKSFPKERLLNLHGSQLPLYRGGNLFSWYVLNKVRLGVCLLHHISLSPDQGNVIKYSDFLYPASCRKPIDYMESYENHNSIFLKEFISGILNGTEDLRGHHQPEYLSTYWPRLKSNLNGWINWDWKGSDVELFISAFDDPYGGAITTWRSKQVSIKNVFFQPGNNYHPFQYGIVLRNNHNWLNVAVEGGELIVTDISAVGFSIMDQIKPGDRLITPHGKLELAKKRVIKRDNGLEFQSDVQ